MSAGYQAVGWNPQKKRYDQLLLGGVGLYLAVFIGVSALAFPDATAETLIIRGLGTAALALLHLILCVGPLARLEPRLLPLLYNRRHMGVTMFVLAAGHGLFSLVQFHALGDLNPLLSLLVSNPRWDSLPQFPFQLLGALALVQLFLMAATSHDFWLKNLSAPVWKALHMGVYGAYALLIAHVALGALQAETSPVLAAALGAGLLMVLGLHLAAARVERRVDEARPAPAEQGYVAACRVEEIPEKRARIVCLSGERVAVFRYDAQVSAISNACRHQNGPLGEGRIIDGCVTCPWHGYQYRPHDGASPPPFTETVPTFRVRVVGGQVWVHPTPLPPGTPVEPARVHGEGPADHTPLYVGYIHPMPASLAAFTRRVAGGLLVGAAALAATIALSQRPFGASVFEFGVARPLDGEIALLPFPVLLVERPGQGGRSAWLLVDQGKHGADAALAGLDGHKVHLEGALIYRDDQTMVELVPGSIEDRGPGAPPPQPVALGEVRVRGEIIDSKCFLGVMNPGDLKPHRDCATRCISGGIPPMLLVRLPTGGARYLMLVGADGEAIGPQLLDRIAEPVEVTGALERAQDLWILKTSSTSIIRL